MLGTAVLTDLDVETRPCKRHRMVYKYARIYDESPEARLAGMPMRAERGRHGTNTLDLSHVPLYVHCCDFGYSCRHFISIASVCMAFKLRIVLKKSVLYAVRTPTWRKICMDQINIVYSSLLLIFVVNKLIENHSILCSVVYTGLWCPTT